MSWTSIHPPIAAVALAGFVACAAAIGATANTDDTSGGTAVERDDVDLIFESDWTTALGSTNAALLDTSKPVPWTSRLDQGSALRVLEGGTFRMPGNALEVRAVARGGSAGAYAANLRVDTGPSMRFRQQEQ